MIILGILTSILWRFHSKINILEKITNPDNIGLHLVYSQFRTLEGIGILSLILKANGLPNSPPAIFI